MKPFRLLWLLTLAYLSVGSGAYAQPALSDTSGYVDVEDARLFFRVIGEGTPLVLVHGGPGMSHDYLAPQFIRLLADDYRLIFYDQRGSGRSTGVEDTTRLTMAQFVEDLGAVRRAFNLERMNLIGHSFGGLLAMYYASAYPSSLDKLLLLDPNAASWELMWPYVRQTFKERRTEADLREMVEIWENSRSDPDAMERYSRLYFRPFFHDPALVDSLALDLDERYLANSSVTNPQVQEELGEYDIHDQLSSITAPTLILYCEAGVVSVEAAEAIHERIPNSRLIVLEDVGHFPYIEAPQAFKAAVKAFIW